MSVLVSLRIWSSLNSGVDTLTLENLSTIIIFYSHKFHILVKLCNLIFDINCVMVISKYLFGCPDHEFRKQPELIYVDFA